MTTNANRNVVRTQPNSRRAVAAELSNRSVGVVDCHPEMGAAITKNSRLPVFRLQGLAIGRSHNGVPWLLSCQNLYTVLGSHEEAYIPQSPFFCQHSLVSS